MDLPGIFDPGSFHCLTWIGLGILKILKGYGQKSIKMLGILERWIYSCSCVSYLGILECQGQLWERIQRWVTVEPALRGLIIWVGRWDLSNITWTKAEVESLQIQSWGGRGEGALTSKWDRPGLELCPVIMTTTTSFVEHLAYMFQGVTNKAVPFRIEGLIPRSWRDCWLSALFENCLCWRELHSPRLCPLP